MGSCLVIYMINYVLILFLVCPILPAAQAQFPCAPLEYRIIQDTKSETALRKFYVDLQFYNPNSENYVLFLPSYYLDPVSMDSELVEKNMTAYVYNGLPQTPTYWRFLPGIITISVLIEVYVTGSQDSAEIFLPDGNYTLSYYYSSRVSGYPLTVQTKAMKISNVIETEPDWNYEKEGGVGFVSVSDRYTGCETPGLPLLLLGLTITVILGAIIILLLKKRRKKQKQLQAFT